MNKLDLISIRSYKKEDKSFILATWLRGLYYGETWFTEIPKNIFMKNYHEVIEKILGNPKNTVFVACLKEEEDVILGYAILGQPGVLHYVFVKSAWRGIKIATSLVPPNTNTVTHLTKSGKSILSNRPNVVFNPFAVN